MSSVPWAFFYHVGRLESLIVLSPIFLGFYSDDLFHGPPSIMLAESLIVLSPIFLGFYSDDDLWDQCTGYMRKTREEQLFHGPPSIMLAESLIVLSPIFLGFYSDDVEFC
ncbi:hypothetical protein Bbelb_381870 [Branchiostoma belcheri]|nr:hypothetical protein Bbelb_381870 [Branchiostoma belcheri]